MDHQKLSEEILTHLGGKDNLESYTNCMTRLRVYPKDRTKVDFEALKELQDVMGVVDAEQVQVILGPGHAQTVKELIDDMTPFETIEKNTDQPKTTEVLEDIGEAVTFTQKIKNFLQKVGSIFVPLMPYFIVYGFIALIPEYFVDSSNIMLYSLATHLKELLLYGLIALIGYSSAKTFTATPIYGAVIAIIIYAVAQFSTTTQISNFSSLTFLQNGTTLAIIFSTILMSKIEKLLKKVLPNLLSFYLLPILTVLLTMIIGLTIILPIAAAIMTAILWFIEFILLAKLGAIGGFILSIIFLPTIILGIHQVLYPIHIQLILANGGNFLFPILATAGAGQLGMALALYLIEKNKEEKDKIKKVLPASLLGMNEQLIFGIAYPRFYSFITGCIGGAIGGAFLGFLYQQGEAVLSTTIGPSGFLLLSYILNYQWLNYLLALLISYGGGFIITLLFGRKIRPQK